MSRPAPSAPSERPDLLMIGPLLPHTTAQLEAAYTIHRYDLAADKEALVAKLAPHLRAIATRGDYPLPGALIERFLADGDKVKATIFFRGRENAHPEIGRRILERLVGELGDIAITESDPQKEGNQLHTILAPKPGVKRAVRAEE